MNDKGMKILQWIGKVCLWLGAMTILGAGAILVWYFASGGSQEVSSLKWGQFIQTVGLFLLPPLLCAVVYDTNANPFRWLHLNKGASWKTFVLAVAVMLCALPAINLLVDLNSRMVLPESLHGLEQWMKGFEEAAAQLMEKFLQTDSVWGMLVNVGLIALLPAISEELTFRGTLQQLLHGDAWQEGTAKWKVHAAIWGAAIIFSAIHFQFYGFVPRMIMGAMFGYAFVWSGSLWVPIIMHFTNNFMVVVLTYGFDRYAPDSKNYADTFGAGTTWWVGVISLVLMCALLWLLYRSTRKE